MNDVAAALRQIADSIDKGHGMLDASAASLVLVDGHNHISVTYIGRQLPAEIAGMNILNMGMQHSIDRLAIVATHGSTH